MRPWALSWEASDAFYAGNTFTFSDSVQGSFTTARMDIKASYYCGGDIFEERLDFADGEEGKGEADWLPHTLQTCVREPLLTCLTCAGELVVAPGATITLDFQLFSYGMESTLLEYIFCYVLFTLCTNSQRHLSRASLLRPGPAVGGH